MPLMRPGRANFITKSKGNIPGYLGICKKLLDEYLFSQSLFGDEASQYVEKRPLLSKNKTSNINIMFK